MAVFLLTWAALLALHVWDSQDQPGARGIAELASGILGTAGLLLFGLTDVLRRAGEPEVPLALLPGLRADAVTARETPALRQILLALPTLGMLAGALLAAAVVLLVLRVWLGTMASAIAAKAGGSRSPSRSSPAACGSGRCSSSPFSPRLRADDAELKFRATAGSRFDRC